MHITNVNILQNLDRDLDFILQDVTEIEGLESEEELELLRDISQLARFIDMECLNRLGCDYLEIGGKYADKDYTGFPGEKKNLNEGETVHETHARILSEDDEDIDCCDNTLFDNDIDGIMDDVIDECKAHDAHAKDKRLLDQEELLNTLKRTTFEYKAINDALYEEAECNALDIEDFKYEIDFQVQNADILKDRISELESENNRLRVGLELGDDDIVEVWTIKNGLLDVDGNR